MEGLLRVVTATWPQCALMLWGHICCVVSHGKPGEGVDDLAFTFVFERAKQMCSSTAKHRHSVWDFIASWTPRRAAEKCQLSPPGFWAPTEVCVCGRLHPQSEAGGKPYRRRWGAPAHVGLPGLRGCRRGERSKPGRSRSWWRWSESGWSYWWGSAGNLLLETNAQGGSGEWWEQQTIEICEAVTAFYSPRTPPYHKRICTRPHKHIHTLPTQGVILQTSQKMGLVPMKRTFGSKTSSLWEV